MPFGEKRRGTMKDGDYVKAGWTCESLSCHDEDDGNASLSRKHATLPSRSSTIKRQELSKTLGEKTPQSSISSGSTSKGQIRRRDILEALRNFTREQVGGANGNGSATARRKSAHSSSHSTSSRSQSDNASGELSLRQWNKQQRYAAAYDISTSYGVDAEMMDCCSSGNGTRTANKSTAKEQDSKNVEAEEKTKTKPSFHSRSRSLFTNHGPLFGGGSNGGKQSGNQRKARETATTAGVQQEILSLARVPASSEGTTHSKDDSDGSQSTQTRAKHVRERTQTLSGPISRPSTASADPSTHAWLTAESASSRSGASYSLNRRSGEDASRLSTFDPSSNDANDALLQLSSQLLRPSNMAPDPLVFGRRQSTAARRYAARVMRESGAEEASVADAKAVPRVAARRMTDFPHTAEAYAKPTAPLPPRRQALRARVQSSNDVRGLNAAHQARTVAAAPAFDEERQEGTLAHSPLRKAKALQNRTSESSLCPKTSRRPSTADNVGVERLGKDERLERMFDGVRHLDAKCTVTRRASEGALHVRARMTKGRSSHDEGRTAGREAVLDADLYEATSESAQDLSRSSLCSSSTSQSMSSMVTDTSDDASETDGHHSLSMMKIRLTARDSEDDADVGRVSPISFASANSEAWGSCVSNLSTTSVHPSATVRSSKRQSSGASNCEADVVPPVPVVPAKYAVHKSHVTHSSPNAHIIQIDDPLPTAQALHLDLLAEGRIAKDETLDVHSRPMPSSDDVEHDDEDAGSICLETPTFGYVSSFTTAPALTPRASDYATFENGAKKRTSFSATRSQRRDGSLDQRPVFTMPQFRRPASMSSLASGAQSGYDTFPLQGNEKDRLYPFKMHVGSVSPKTVSEEDGSHVAAHDTLAEWQSRLESARRPSEPQHGLGLSHVKLALAENARPLRQFARSPCPPVEEEGRVAGQDSFFSRQKPAAPCHEKSAGRSSSRRLSVSHQAILALQNRSNSFRLGGTSSSRTRS